MNNQVHLALGSNLGNKKNNIITTLKLIDTCLLYTSDAADE